MEYMSLFSETKLIESQNKTKEDQEAKVEADKDGTVDSVQAEKSQSGDRGLNQCTALEQKENWEINRWQSVTDEFTMSHGGKGD